VEVVEVEQTLQVLLEKMVVLVEVQEIILVQELLVQEILLQ
jgi:hypothetical protein